MFTRAELNGMRCVQNAHMMDTCVIYRVASRTKNTRGETIKNFGTGCQSICGVQMEPLAREYGDGIVETNIDAILRLPLGTVVEPGDEIEIVKRFGECVEPRRYEVDRFLNDGPSGCRAYLKVRNV
jgi:hypothetical protein